MLYSVTTLAKHWGVSEPTIRRMIYKGEITAFRVRCQWRIRWEEVTRIEAFPTQHVQHVQPIQAKGASP